MSDWDTLHCHNHPGRIALERCEVCAKPLCAYCLYYTEDGQRLCAEHAEIARAQGVEVAEPSTYADQLIGAQAGADRKLKRGATTEDRTLYKGNSTDLTGLIGMLLGVITLGTCCGLGYCLPVVGVGVSIVALLNANKAHDKARTRRLGLIGLITSGALVLVLVSCIVMYALSFAPFFTMLAVPLNNLYTPPATLAPRQTPTRTPVVSPTPTVPESLSSAHATTVQMPPPPDVSGEPPLFDAATIDALPVGVGRIDLLPAYFPPD